MWSEEELKALDAASQTMSIGRAHLVAIASRAVELVAARDGTMTAGGLTRELVRSTSGEMVLNHLAAQGARVAELEVERDGLERSVRACAASKEELLKENTGLSANFTAACRKADEQRERAELAESALAAERTGDAQMKADFGAFPDETLLGMVARIAKERDAATQLAAHRLTGRMDAASEVERLRAERNACCGRAEDAEARLQRMRDGINDMVKRCVEMAKDLSVAIARGALGMPAKNVSVHNITPAMEDKGDEAHDNEQERSEAFARASCAHGLTAGDCSACSIHDAALTQGYDDGVEAMRAACWEAAQGVMQTFGIGITMREAMKAAIEGATP